jgi:hypothetical protein
MRLTGKRIGALALINCVIKTAGTYSSPKAAITVSIGRNRVRLSSG